MRNGQDTAIEALMEQLIENGSEDMGVVFASAARCGLEMAALSQRIEPHWQVRIGLHAGPIVAGIVGRHKFLYDLWGNTVNVAARITEQAAPGTVCASAETWARTGSIGEQRALGSFEIKGKGSIELVEIRGLV